MYNVTADVTGVLDDAADPDDKKYRIDAVDAILELDIAERLDEFLTISGRTDPDTLLAAGERLAKGYDGIPDMIQVLLRWSETFTNDPHSLLRRAVENSLSEVESRLIPNINSALRDGDFSLPGLREINASPHWKHFFLDMAKRNNENQANTHSILPQALQRQEQYDALGIDRIAFSSQAQFCSHFERLFMSLSLSPSATGTDLEVVSESIDTANFMSKFIALCSHDERTFRSALYVLNQLAMRATDAFTRHLAYKLTQVIKKEAINQVTSIGMGPPSYASLSARKPSEEESRIFVAKLAIHVRCTSRDCEMRTLIVDALLKIALSKCDVGYFQDTISLDREIRIVLSVYATLIIGLVTFGGNTLCDKNAVSKDRDLKDLVLYPLTFDEKCVYIRILNDEQIVKSLIEASFSLDRKPSRDDTLKPEKRRVLSLLLAFCKVFHKYDDVKVLNKIKNTEERKALCAQVSEQLQQIDMAIVTCEQLKPESSVSQITSQRTTLIPGCKDPFLAPGFLIWVIEGLKGGSNVRDLRQTAIYHLAYLSMLADHHPRLHNEIVTALKDAILRSNYDDLKDGEIIEIKNKVVDCIAGMVRLGLGLPLLEVYVRDLIQPDFIDISYLRKILMHILNNSAPPYSPTFINYVNKAKRSGKLNAGMTTELRDAINSFGERCLDL